MGTHVRYLVACMLLMAGCPDDPVGAGSVDDDDDGSTGSPSTTDPTTGASAGTTGGTTDPGTTGGSSTTSDPDTTGGDTTGGSSSESSTGAQDAPEIEVTVDGNAVQSADTVTAANTTAVGMSGETFTVEISNTGTGDLDLGAISLMGAAAHFTLEDDSVDTTVAPGESTSLGVVFEPTNGGFKTALLVIASNDADEDPFEVELHASTTPNLWRNITPKAGPSSRYNMALAQLDAGTLLTFGGRGAGGTVLGDTWTYDVEAGTWSQVTPEAAPSARFSYGMDNAGPGLAVLTGGTLVPGEGGNAQSDTWHFEIGDMNWVQSMNNGTPPARHQAAVAGFDGGLFSYGGIDDTPASAGGLFLYAVDTEAWISLDVEDPGARIAAAAAFDGQGVVTLSGGTDETVLADAYDFVLDDSTISLHADPALGAVFSHELVYLRPDFAVAFGGRDTDEEAINPTFAYRPSSGVWSDLAPSVSPSPRFNFGMTAVGENKLIVFGGATGGGKVGAVPTAEVWEYVGPLPEF